jgi:predicted RNase H-like nuclease (RuvC/YqgF family)
VQNELKNEFSSQIDVLKNKSESLETTINNKDKQINTLQQELNKFRKEENKPEHNKSIENDNSENNLFTNTDKKLESSRKSELLKTPITKLKKIAKEINVANLSKYKKANIEELVEEILKKENK